MSWEQKEPVFLDWIENGFGFGFIGNFERPTIVDVLRELMMFIAPLWVVVLVGVLVGWAWKPRWANVLSKDTFPTLPITTTQSSCFTFAPIPSLNSLRFQFQLLLPKAGNRTKGAAFSPKGWSNLVTKFCNETGLNYDKDQVKSKWDVLKTDWRVWEKLKSLDTGLGWDAMKGTIDASDDWWNLKLKGCCSNWSSCMDPFFKYTPSNNATGGCWSVGTSRESPSSIDNVMEIVRALPRVDSTFVVQASYVLMKRSCREMILNFKEPESQLQCYKE
ncbi:hypothetical protein SO802_001214 [Lithocarpus litseifolius]|uniref:Myb/SANT-like domain-containing protein n=1 Tax=Lithocarpus litseifolius TaxID=425828 RepID=A0AAW2DTR7_9ROSI